MWHFRAAQQPSRDRATAQAVGEAMDSAAVGRAADTAMGAVAVSGQQVGRLAGPAAALLLATLLAGCAAPAGGERQDSALPAGFVYLHAVAPDVQQDMRYYGSNNFLGRPVAGYQAPACILSEPAARAVQAAQAQVRPLGLTIKVFDCYRPQTAVNDFVR